MFPVIRELIPNGKFGNVKNSTFRQNLGVSSMNFRVCPDCAYKYVA